MPASVQIYSCNKDLQTQPVARRSFFRCSSVQFHWNKDSFGVLFVAQSDVDKTNQSYYGETKLNYLTIDGSHEGLVSLSKFRGYMFISFICVVSIILWHKTVIAIANSDLASLV
jgi:Eukaryotic translation initiation factor eIF2A